MLYDMSNNSSDRKTRYEDETVGNDNSQSPASPSCWVPLTKKRLVAGGETPQEKLLVELPGKQRRPTTKVVRHQHHLQTKYMSKIP